MATAMAIIRWLSWSAIAELGAGPFSLRAGLVAGGQGAVSPQGRAAGPDPSGRQGGGACPGLRDFPGSPATLTFSFGLADHAAFVFGTQTVTYGELVDEARQLASVLRDAGVAKGDRVAVLSPNRPEIFSTYLGLTMNGAAIVPVNAEFAPHEIRYILERSGARMVEGWWSVRPNSPIS